MFDILKPAETLSVSSKENETPDASQAEEKKPSEDSKSASEGEKTPKKTDEGAEKVKDDKDMNFNDPKHPLHSRFKELHSKSKKFEKMYEESQNETREMREKLNQMEELIQKVQQSNQPTPEFETIEDLTAYMQKLPDEITKKVLSQLQKEVEIEGKQELKAQQTQDSAQKYIDDKFSEMKEEGKEFDEQELLAFAVEYKINDLDKALDLYQLKKSKDEADKKQKEEEIEKRKKDSKLHTSKAGSTDTRLVWKPGMTLDKIIEAAKANLRN